MSTYLNYSIQTKEEFKGWILRKLGAPLVTVEITDDQLEDNISDAVEYFTKYAQQDTDYVAVNLSGYVEDTGVSLPDNVTSVFVLDDMTVGLNGDFNRLFSIPNSMLNAGMLAIPYSDTGYGWVNWELFHQNLDNIKRFLGGGFKFNYNPRNQNLKLIPDPVKEGLQGWIVMGCNTIREETMQYGEEWVKKYALALTKIIVGRVRTKYNSAQLLGGATLDAALIQEGITERDDLMEKLRTEEQGVFTFWVG